eukprot:10256780-Alexandrium_andersonii.AAC.1
MGSFGAPSSKPIVLRGARSQLVGPVRRQSKGLATLAVKSGDGEPTRTLGLLKEPQGRMEGFGARVAV